MLIRVLAGLCLALLVAAAWLWWRMEAQTERAAVAEQSAAQAADTAEAWRVALEQQTAEVGRTGRLLGESRQAHDRLRQTTDRRIRDYERTLQADVETVDWDRVPVPAAVARRMCEYPSDRPPGGGPLPSTAGGAAAADPGPACRPSTGQLWRWAERLIEAVERGNQDKAALRAWAGRDRAAPAAPPQ